MATHYAFYHHELLAKGTLDELYNLLKDKIKEYPDPVLVFSSEDGKQIDLDFHQSHDSDSKEKRDFGDNDTNRKPSIETKTQKRGRPKLGVVGREVTLLPRHWEWLDNQRGGASATLRKLIDQARREHSKADAVREAQDRTNRFLSAIAGNLPGYEDATRALYSGNEVDFKQLCKVWPKDIRQCAWEFANDAF